MRLWDAVEWGLRLLQGSGERIADWEVVGLPPGGGNLSRRLGPGLAWCAGENIPAHGAGQEPPQQEEQWQQR